MTDPLAGASAPAVCSVADCGKAAHTLGWCRAHYVRWWRHGSTDVVLKGGVTPADPMERFLSHVEKTPTCWLWQGRKAGGGYATFGLPGGRAIAAHRFAYENLVGPIPEGLQLDHLCRVRHCVNPDHLEPVTARENTRRGTSPSSVNAARTHCIRGHAFDEANTYYYDRGRRCRTCQRERARRA